jgi:tRNA A37 threonylcarbamoyltransferase TsaD
MNNNNHNQYISYYVSTPRTEYMYKIAEEYFNITETYDRAVCSLYDEVSGISYPSNYQELANINSFAQQVRVILSEKYGVDRKFITESIQNYTKNGYLI